MAPEFRAAVLHAPGRAELRAMPMPEPGAGQVRVRIEGSGVCGSDAAVWEGRPWFDYPRPPGAPGHEAWGRVDALGEGVRGLDAGQRVTGLFGHAYATHEIVSADQLVPLPAVLDGKPFPGEALACALNAFRRSDVRPGHTVAILGAGFLGALLTSLASAAGAHVLAISRRAYALKLAESMGARHLLRLGADEDHVAEVERLTGGLCDRVIEVTGKQAPLDLAAKLTRVRGRLVIAGYHQDGPRSVDMQLWNWRGLDVVNAHERDPAVYLQGIRDAIDAVLDGRLDPFPLLTHTYPLSDIATAFHMMQTRPDGFLKAVVRP